MNTMGGVFQGLHLEAHEDDHRQGDPLPLEQGRRAAGLEALRFSRAMEQTSASAAAIRAVEAGRMP